MEPKITTTIRITPDLRKKIENYVSFRREKGEQGYSLVSLVEEALNFYFDHEITKTLSSLGLAYRLKQLDIIIEKVKETSVNIVYAADELHLDSIKTNIAEGVFQGVSQAMLELFPELKKKRIIK